MTPTQPRLTLESLEDRCLPTTTRFINNLYVDLLGRAGAPSEVLYWTNRVNTGRSSARDTAQAFVQSDEFLINQVVSDYRALLGRIPAASEIGFWRNARRSGLDPRRESALFVASPEYYTRQGSTPLGWINAAFRDLLGRFPSNQELSTTVSSGIDLRDTRLRIAEQLVFGNEATLRLVDSAYVDIFERNADTPGLSFWGGQIQTRLTPADFLAILASSREYINTKSGGLDISSPTPPSPPSLPQTTPQVTLPITTFQVVATVTPATPGTTTAQFTVNSNLPALGGLPLGHAFVTGLGIFANAFNAYGLISQFGTGIVV